MQINSLEKFANLYGRIDAILIVNKENIDRKSTRLNSSHQF